MDFHQILGTIFLVDGASGIRPVQALHNFCTGFVLYPRGSRNHNHNDTFSTIILM